MGPRWLIARARQSGAITRLRCCLVVRLPVLPESEESAPQGRHQACASEYKLEPCEGSGCHGLMHCRNQRTPGRWRTGPATCCSNAIGLTCEKVLACLDPLGIRSCGPAQAVGVPAGTPHPFQENP